MVTYSVHVLPENSLTISNGQDLRDGGGGGGGLVGETITFNQLNFVEVAINDAGTETRLNDDVNDQVLTNTVTLNGTTFTPGDVLEAEYQLTLQHPVTGDTFIVYAANLRDISSGDFTPEGLMITGSLPETGVAYNVIAGREPIPPEENTVLCFAAGTLIETLKGDTAVEYLAVGDMLKTVSGAYVPIRCLLSETVQIGENEKLRPVRFRAGSLGNGLPRRGLRVSRQHRMRIVSDAAVALTGQRDVLVPAVKLTSLPGVELDNEACEVTYFHIITDQHEMIFAEGSPSETFYLGPQARAALPTESLNELTAIFPEFAQSWRMPKPACPILERRKDVQKLLC